MDHQCNSKSQGDTSSIDVVFVEVPYREGVNSIFQEYNRAYSQVFAQFWGIAPYQDGFANFPNVPLWISCLMPVVKKLGLTAVKVRTSIHEIDLPSASVYLLSCFTSNFVYTLKVARWIKEHFPGSTIVLGGSHATVAYKECIQVGAFDIVVIGEGEDSLEEILCSDVDDKENLKSIKGICFLDKGRVHVTPPRENVFDLDRRPLPVYSFLDTTIRNEIREGALFTTKGCPWQCVYCAEGSSKLRTKSPQRIAEETHYLLDAFPNLRFFRLVDSSFTMRKDLEQVCRKMSQLEIPWSCQTRVDLMQPDRLSMLRSGGCRVINVGVESGDDHILGIVNKRISISQAIESCRLAKQYGFKVITYWMIGLPGETKETAQRTIHTITELIRNGICDLAELCICVPYPGTELYKSRIQFGIRIEETQLFDNFLENSMSCMYNTSLSNRDIYQLWLQGLESITEALRLRYPDLLLENTGIQNGDR